MKRFVPINELCSNISALNKLAPLFVLLDQINYNLRTILPAQLREFCHAGSIDAKNNHLILFVTNQHAHNLVRNFVPTILTELTNLGFRFDAILLKASVANKSSLVNQARTITEEQKAKLVLLATAIGKPKLIKTTTATEHSQNSLDKEIDF